MLAPSLNISITELVINNVRDTILFFVSRINALVVSDEVFPRCRVDFGSLDISIRRLSSEIGNICFACGISTINDLLPPELMNMSNLFFIAQMNSSVDLFITPHFKSTPSVSFKIISGLPLFLPDVLNNMIFDVVVAKSVLASLFNETAVIGSLLGSSYIILYLDPLSLRRSPLTSIICPSVNPTAMQELCKLQEMEDTG